MMLTIGKILIILTLILPISTISIILSLKNFGVDALSEVSPKIAGFSLQESTVYEKPGNAFWYLFTFIASIFALVGIFKYQGQ
jgi:hypothetical protein